MCPTAGDPATVSDAQHELDRSSSTSPISKCSTRNTHWRTERSPEWSVRERRGTTLPAASSTAGSMAHRSAGRSSHACYRERATLRRSVCLAAASHARTRAPNDGESPTATAPDRHLGILLDPRCSRSRVGGTVLPGWAIGRRARMAQAALDCVVSGAEVEGRVVNDGVSRIGAHRMPRQLAGACSRTRVGGRAPCSSACARKGGFSEAPAVAFRRGSGRAVLDGRVELDAPLRLGAGIAEALPRRGAQDAWVAGTVLL